MAADRRRARGLGHQRTDELPTLSVIVPVHDNATTLAAQLDGIRAGLSEAVPTEIIVVDNLSSDGTAVVARRWSSHTAVPVRIESAAERASEPYARNLGLERADGDLIAYCDGDDVVNHTWVGAMAGGLAHHDYVTGPMDTERLNPPWLAQLRGQALFEARPLLSDTVPFAHGANMGFRRSVLVDLGGFDEHFTTGCDVAVAVTAWRHGIELGFEPEALVHYRLRSTGRDRYRQGRSYGAIQPDLRNLAPELHDPSAERRARLRRIGWLARNLPRTYGRSRRARWLWVAAQLEGETRARLRALADRDR